MSAPTATVSRGQRAPAFALPSTSSQTIELVNYLDKVRVAIVFLGASSEAASITAALDAAMVEFGHRRVQLLVVAAGPIAQAGSMLPDGGTVPVLGDGDGSVTRTYVGASDDDAVHAVVIDEAGVVNDAWRSESGDLVADLLARLDDAHARPATQRPDNSPNVVDRRHGGEVDIEMWDPMPEELQLIDRVDESSLPNHPMEGEAPTG